jgi:hypothetical protein
MSEYTQEYTDIEMRILKSKLDLIRMRSVRKEDTEESSSDIKAVLDIVIEDYKSPISGKIFALHENLLRSNTPHGNEYAGNYFLVRNIQTICERRQRSSETSDDL